MQGMAGRVIARYGVTGVTGRTDGQGSGLVPYDELFISICTVNKEPPSRGMVTHSV